jgi:hypothetical protein
MQRQNDERHDDLQELGDPEFFRRWAELRRRIALGSKSAIPELKREYAEVSCEYRRRIDGETNNSE